MRKVFALIIAFGLASACSDAVAPEQTLPITGWYSDEAIHTYSHRPEDQPDNGMVRSRDEWMRFWVSMGEDPFLLPDIDFSRNSIIYATLGAGSGDPRATFTSATLVDHALIVHVQRTQGPSMVLWIEKPMTIGVIPATPRSVRFVDDPG